MQFTYEFDFFVTGGTIEFEATDLRAVVGCDESGWELLDIETCVRRGINAALVWVPLETSNPLDALVFSAAVTFLKSTHQLAIETIWIEHARFNDVVHGRTTSPAMLLQCQYIGERL